MLRSLSIIALAATSSGVGAQRFSPLDTDLPHVVASAFLTAPFAKPIDADGDGDLDLVVLQGDGVDRIFINDGAARFTARPLGLTATPRPSRGLDPLRYPHKLFAVDVDSDGDQDLVYQQFLFQRGYVWENDGSGRFTDLGPVSPEYFEGLGDLDNDGLLDAFAPDRIVLDVFGAAQRHPFTPQGQIQAFCDLDGDGDLDVVSRFFGLFTYLNDGTGQFTAGPTYPIHGMAHAGDLTGDGLCELLTFGDEILGLRNGSLVPIVQGMPPDVTEVVDVDGDGVDDLLWFQRGQSEDRVVYGGSVSSLQATGTPIEHRLGFPLARADFDGDGRLDFISYSATRLVLQPSPRAFQLAGRRSVTFTESLATVFADVDRDGDLDNIKFETDPRKPYEPSVAPGEPGGFGNPAPLPFIPYRSVLSIAVGDVTGDGYPDIVGNRVLFENDQQGGFSSRLTLFGNDPVLVDLDADGRLDVLSMRNSNPLYLQVHMQTAVGEFSTWELAEGPSISPNPNPNPPPQVKLLSLGAADFDGDGDPDVATSLLMRNNLSVPALWRNDGFGHLTLETISGVPDIVAIADFNQDRSPDLLSLSGVFLNDGQGVFTHLPGSPQDIEKIVDLNSDGLPDGLTRDGIRYGRRGGGFDPLRPYEGLVVDPASPVSLFAEDLDRDGDVDLFDSEQIAFNLETQLHLPLPLRPGRDFVVEVHGVDPWNLAVPHFSTQPTNVVLLGLGTLWVAPLDLIVLPPVPLNPDGSAVQLVFPQPSAPSILGTSLYGQALFANRNGGLRLGNRAFAPGF